MSVTVLRRGHTQLFITRHGLLERSLVGIDEVAYIRARHFREIADQRASPATDADDSDIDLIAGWDCAGPRSTQRRECSSDKAASVHCVEYLLNNVSIRSRDRSPS